MKVAYSKSIDCTNKRPADCSDAILAALGHGDDLVLRAEIPSDTVNGSVTILHLDPPDLHQIIIEIYEGDEAPTATIFHGVIEGRQSTLRRPDPMPSEETIRNRLN